MNNTRYLEVSSSNRNRNQFPYPSDFDIILGVPSLLNIQDPIITGTNLFIFGNFSGAISVGTIAEGSTTNAIILKQEYTTSNTENTMPFGYDVNDSATILNTDPLFYNGLILAPGSDGIISDPIETRVITSYDPTSATVYVNQSFKQSTIIPGLIYSITIFIESSKQINLPVVDAFLRKASIFSEYYNNYYLVNQTQSMYENINSNKIVRYNAELRILNLQNILSGNISDLFSIVKYLPENKFVITDVDPQKLQITLDPSLTYGTGHFIGKYVYNTGIILPIQTIFPINPFDYGQQSIDYDSKVANIAFLVTDYSGFPENILTVSEYSTNNLKFSEFYPRAYTESPLYGPCTTIVSISSLVQDNFYPLQYSGSIVSQNEAVNYEISLIQLCLPNVILKTGSRIAQYSYIYVEFRPIGSPSTVSKNVIYSNNPNSENALFSIAVTDVVRSENSVFTRISTNQVQTIKIKPNDSYHFSVFLSDGSLFIPYDTEFTDKSPFPPNQFLQIEAVFGFYRL